MDTPEKPSVPLEKLAVHCIPEGVSEQRLDVYASQVFDVIPSRKKAWKLVRQGLLLVNNDHAVPNHVVRSGETLAVYRQPDRRQHYVRKLPILYEDNSLAVINKPAGLHVSGNRFRTVENALPGNLTPAKDGDVLPWPRPVHRLDVATSGLLLVAKTASAAAQLSEQFATRQVRKQYRAIVVGRLEGEGEVRAAVGGRDAVTLFRAIEHTRSLHTAWSTTIDLLPITGRTHQLRIHMAEKGHPVLGDKMYGKQGAVYRGKGLFLCAVRLAFQHPANGTQLDIQIEEPRKFGSYRRRESRRWQAVGLRGSNPSSDSSP